MAGNRASTDSANSWRAPEGVPLLRTGQVRCYDPVGRESGCAGSAQDAEHPSGAPWPEPRFSVSGSVATDLLTGLAWTLEANLARFPVGWREAFDIVAVMNREQAFGFADWRVPNRRELRSILSHQTAHPALPEGHPFRNVFEGWYWTSTTAAFTTAYAWQVHLAGARTFHGSKQRFALLWPVRGDSRHCLWTGQTLCFDETGKRVPCAGTGQDAEFGRGQRWPEPRFHVEADGVLDRATGLCWMRDADLSSCAVTWSEAFETVWAFNRSSGTPARWRLPNINELESLVDCDRHTPALPAGHPFTGVGCGYWSSTTSAFEPDWAWALYLETGACGVGQKNGRHFHVWPVRR